jgi:phosphoglucomutase
MNSETLRKAQAWAQNPAIEAQDKKEIQDLIDQLPRTETELTERFYKGLEFGTGGMRGVLGMGENRINRYTVRTAAQAFALTLLKHFPNGAHIVASYDSRHGSREFAEETLGVMAAFGIKGRIFKTLTPTPMLSYAIRHYKAHGGVMVTASHNPPKYNGYKVFWQDGAQVVAPVDKAIVETYNSITHYSELKSMSFADAKARGFVEEVQSEIDEAYHAMVEKDVIIDRDMCRTHGHELKIVYTPLHGTGLVPCETIAARLGFSNFKTIAEQAKPDGNFPTVKFPNPEDPSALKMAVDEMLATQADIVFGTDPDGDRLGVVINDNGVPFYINGNQLGALFLHYVFSERQKRGTLPKNPLVVKSIVTSPVQEAIAQKFGGTVLATLTGFKWMADLIRRLEEEKSPLNFVFASEESFGYMPHKASRDKDGVSSMALLSEIALSYKRRGKNLVQALDEIAETYGFFHEILVSRDYEGIEGSAKIQRIMDHFRQGPLEIAGLGVEKMIDYQKPGSGLPASNVLGFTFKTGDQLFLRPSGTEPKIKFYAMVSDRSGTLAERKAAAKKKTDILEAFILKTCEAL